ncbi:MAG: hypothetical protein WKF87_19075 [Chryseolinea sp.]
MEISKRVSDDYVHEFENAQQSEDCNVMGPSDALKRLTLEPASLYALTLEPARLYALNTSNQRGCITLIEHQTKPNH